MTPARVQESFAAPDTFSVWALPGFIGLLERSGFSAIRHRLQFQSLLALPLLAGTMALLAAGFSMRPSRRGGVAQMIGSGVGAGFLLFVVTKVSEEFGQSGVLPSLLAAWAPVAAGLLFLVVANIALAAIVVPATEFFRLLPTRIAYGPVATDPAPVNSPKRLNSVVRKTLISECSQVTDM